jgi:hypothetical protein
MDLFLDFMVLVWGLIGVFYPSILYKKELLTPQQIERNNCICKRCGIGLIALSLAPLVMKLF